MIYRVLLVDDEKTSYDFVSDLLAASREDRFSVEWETEFDHATDKILSGDYDICLLDYNLGSFTGLELMRHVRERDSRIPIIILTGHGSREIDMDALQAGAAEYLDKSALKPVLVARTIRYAVRRQQDRNELEDLYQKVSELEQLKTDMIRIAAHDLKTPLMAMLNYAQFLQNDTNNPLEDYQQGYVQEVVDGVWRMRRIITDILSLERIQETAEDRYEQTTDLTEQLSNALEGLPPPDRNLTLSTNAPDTEVLVKGDPSQLREATTNLITNAIKYTPDGGKIVVSLAVEDGNAVLLVQDTGYGIPEELQERLFKPFYRVPLRETRQIGGTGLGLHLVHNIIQRHSGELIFQSVYGEGSTFGFRIPLLNS
jgi:two-component system sensor histidine kinase/response regulator